MTSSIVLKAVPSKSKPDRGAVTSFVEVINEAGQVVMTFKVVNIIGKLKVGMSAIPSRQLSATQHFGCFRKAAPMMARPGFGPKEKPRSRGLNRWTPEAL